MSEPVSSVHPQVNNVRPFLLQVHEAELTELHDRLLRARLPDEAHGSPEGYGIDLQWLRGLLSYWAHQFNWRKSEAELNAFPQYKVRLGPIDLHYLHVPGRGPRPLPLLLSHGWPGSVFEFMELLPRLTDPARYGGDPDDAFTVVAPSLPGFGLSHSPGQQRLSLEETSELLFSLMTDVLGYKRFAAHGGDWGSYITARIAYDHPTHLVGMHVTLLSALVASARLDPPTEDEVRYLGELKRWQKDQRAYAFIQGTAPQTLACGLTDSPSGLAAWIAEKFMAWSDPVATNPISRDLLLANISLYWFTQSVASSFWLYPPLHAGKMPLPAGAQVRVPMGHASFPREILRPPRSAAARVFTDLRHWENHDRGGHFPALEEPDALAADLRSFFRPLRSSTP